LGGELSFLDGARNRQQIKLQGTMSRRIKKTAVKGRRKQFKIKGTGGERLREKTAEGVWESDRPVELTAVNLYQKKEKIRFQSSANLMGEEKTDDQEKKREEL